MTSRSSPPSSTPFCGRPSPARSTERARRPGSTASCSASLIEAGNTVIVIEHNLDVVKCADWVIDLGPEGGDEGGRIIAEGTPEEVARVKASYTGQHLAKVLKRHRERLAG